MMIQAPKNKLQRAGVILGAFALLLLVVYSLLTLYYGHRFEAEIQDIRAKGEPISMADIYGEKVPVADNAAPLYERIFPNVPGAMIADGTNPSKAALGDEDRILARLLDADGQVKDSTLLGQADFIISRHRGELEAVDRASRLPRSYFYHASADPISIMFPEFQRSRQLAKLIAAAAIVDARYGRMDQAFRDLDIGFRYSKQLEESHTLIGTLVKAAILNITSNALAEVLRSGTPSEEQARQLSESIGRIDLVPGYVQDLKGERIFGIWIIQELASGHSNAIVQSLDGAGVNEENSVHLPRSRLLAYINGINYLHHMDRTIRVGSRPYRETAASLNKPVKQGFSPLNSMAGTICPDFSRTRSLIDSAMARLALNQAQLGILAYQKRYGALPSSLNEVKSKLRWQIPSDPFSAANLIYRPAGNRFMLYSLGPNLKDDNGLPLKRSGVSITTEPGDIVMNWP